MDGWSLPTALAVGGEDRPIRSDFRDVLYLLGIFADGGYEPDEKAAVCLRVLFVRWEDIPAAAHDEALRAAAGFIDGGFPARERRNMPRTVDWVQDGPIIIPAVNKVLGREVRAIPYLHWWTFLGAYMEIGESLFSTVLALRQKRAKGRKLEKYEQEFYRDNRALVELRKKDTAEDRARRDALQKLFV